MSFHSLLCALRRCKPIPIGLRELSEGVHSLHTTLHALLLFCVLKVDTVLQWPYGTTSRKQMNSEPMAFQDLLLSLSVVYDARFGHRNPFKQIDQSRRYFWPAKGRARPQVTTEKDNSKSWYTIGSEFICFLDVVPNGLVEQYPLLEHKTITKRVV